MKILIACEESQVVCNAFRDRGHEAYSCDILPTSGSHPEWHIQGDVLDIINQDWDMMIGFPPCTHLASSGARWFKDKIISGEQPAAISFFMKLVNANILKIAIENPIGIMSSQYRKPDQIIQPYQFGHPTKKSTCLWLKNLPKLIPTKIVEPEFEIRANGFKMDKWTYEIRKTWDRAYMAREMSKTFQGVGDSMADQWG